LNIAVRYSEAIEQVHWSAPLGLVTVVNADTSALQPIIGEVQKQLQLNSDLVSGRVKACEEFFAENGFRSPLGFQLEQVRRKGLPPGSPLVQALLLAEMSTGLLMGAQDADALRGELVYDLAHAGESFQGMRTEVQCCQNEIVLRDAEGIIASLFQGPDHRTRLSKSTRNIVFFVFSIPGIAISELQEGIDVLRHIFKDACADFEAQVYEHGTRSVG
jgi:B3/4 domain